MRCIREVSERALSVDVIDTFDDTLECLVAALLQQDASHLGSECGGQQCPDESEGWR